MRLPRDDVDHAAHRRRSIDRRRRALEHLDPLDIVEQERRQIGHAGWPAVDEQQRALVDAGELRTESANADAGERTAVLDDIDAGVLLQHVRQIRRDGSLDIGGVDDLDLLRRLRQPRLHAPGR